MTDINCKLNEIKEKPSEIRETLNERGSRYGEFPDQAKISQGIKREMKKGRNWEFLKDVQKEALEMVAHKIARILNGDPDFDDSWLDQIGYVQLVRDELNKK